jgi:prepilin-type N-terminal cleavage/methylation domain-containing protein
MKRHKGFTLIELLVVIAIIALKKQLHTIPNNVPDTFTAWGKYGDPAYFGGWVHNALDQGTYSISPENRPLYWRKMDAKGASKIPLMGGCMWDGSEPYEADAPPPAEGVQLASSNMSIYCLDRHNGEPNTLFMDTSI